MALQTSTIPIQFLGGLDQKRPEKGSLPGKFLALENCVRRKYSLVEKRYGVTALSSDVFGSATDIEEGKYLSTFQDDVYLIGQNKLYSHSAAQNAWIDKGTCTTAQVAFNSLVRGSDTQALADIATSDGFTVLAWEDSRNGVRYSVYDDETGAAVVYDTSVSATGSQPKVVALRDVFLLGYIDGTALKVRVISKATPTTLGSAINVKGSAVASADYWDMDVFENTYAVYAVSSTVPNIEVGYIDQNGAVGNPVVNSLPTSITVGSLAADDCCTVVGDALNGKIWLVYGSTTTIAYGISSDLAVMDDQEVEAIQSRNVTGVVREDDGHLVLFYEIAAVAASDHYTKTARLSWTIGGAVTVASAGAVLIRSVGLVSKAFEVDDHQYFTATHESSLQPTYFTVRDDGFVVARIAGGSGGGVSRDAGGTLKSGIARVQTTDDGFVTAVQVRNRLTIESGGTVLKSNKGLSKATISFDSSIVSDSLGHNEHLAGGSLFAYDGVTVFEHGFHVFPEGVTIGQAGAAGSLADATTYSFRVIYEWTDARGQLHRSAPSTTVSILTTAANRTITVTVPSLRVTNRSKTSIKLVLYMAAAGLSTVYYRKSETANSSSADTVAIPVTTAADATAEILYTTGGLLENIVPPSCKAVHEFKNRLWLIGTETEDLWYSKEHVTGEAVAFSDFFRIPMESDGGPLNAAATMDSNLLLFKSDRIYQMAGEGPLDTGAQNDYGRPQLIASDVGTRIANSVVETPMGVMFKSDKGFYLMNRGFQVKYVGDAVEDYNSLTVSSGVLLADENEVRFTTLEGTCLVYNYYFQQWSVFTDYAAVSACNGLGTYLRLESDGTVQKEVVDQFEDNGIRYSMAIETSWFAFAGLQGFQRVYELELLGDFVSHHYTRLKVAYDYENAYNQTVYFDTRTGLVSDSVYGEGDVYGDDEIVYGGEGSSVYQFRFKPARQKCEAIKVRIEDVDTIGVNGGGSVKLLALAFEIGRKGGLYRLPGAKSIGAT